MQIDLQYIITGERKKKRVVRSDSVINERLIPYAGCILCLMLLNRLDAARSSIAYKRVSTMLRLYEDILLKNENIIMRIRSVSGKTQKEFANLLHVDIKKVRNLEKGNVLPAILLNDHGGMVNDLWQLYDMLTEEEKNSFNSVLFCMNGKADNVQ